MRPHEIEIVDNLIAYAEATQQDPIVKEALEVAKTVGTDTQAAAIATDSVLSRALVSVLDKMSARGVPLDTTRTVKVLAARRRWDDQISVITLHNMIYPCMVGGEWRDQFDGMSFEHMKQVILELNLAGYPLFVEGQTKEDLRRAWELNAE